MSFVIYDTTGVIFNHNTSTVPENDEKNFYIHKKIANYNYNDYPSNHFCRIYFRDIDISRDITIYATGGDLVYIKGKYVREYTKRFIDHIRSTQPDILICEKDSVLINLVTAPMIIEISKRANSFTANSEVINYEFDNRCHCDKCCNCKNECVLKCTKYKINHNCQPVDTIKSLSGCCNRGLDIVHKFRLIESVSKTINKYMAENSPIAKNPSDPKPLLTDDEIEISETLSAEISYNYNERRNACELK